MRDATLRWAFISCHVHEFHACVWEGEWHHTPKGTADAGKCWYSYFKSPSWTKVCGIHSRPFSSCSIKPLCVVAEVSTTELFTVQSLQSGILGRYQCLQQEWNANLWMDDRWAWPRASGPSCSQWQASWCGQWFNAQQEARAWYLVPAMELSVVEG